MSLAFITEVLQTATGLPASKAREAARSLIDAIGQEIKTAGSLSIPGFGTFRMAETKPRKARNPRTGEEIRTKGGKTVRFKPSPTLKGAMKGRGKVSLGRT